jgi:hypothetical protein
MKEIHDQLCVIKNQRAKALEATKASVAKPKTTPQAPQPSVATQPAIGSSPTAMLNNPSTCCIPAPGGILQFHLLDLAMVIQMDGQSILVQIFKTMSGHIKESSMGT